MSCNLIWNCQVKELTTRVVYSEGKFNCMSSCVEQPHKFNSGFVVCDECIHVVYKSLKPEDFLVAESV